MLIWLAPPVSGESTVASRLPPVRLGDAELEHPVERVEREAAAERRQRPPVEALAAPGDERHGGEQEQEVER